VHFALGTSESASQRIDTLAGAKDEKKLKGCIKSEAGHSVLEEKSRKIISLTGSDVSAYNGHVVTLHGIWGSGASAVTGLSGTAGAKGGRTFSVSSVDMTSEKCAK